MSLPTAPVNVLYYGVHDPTYPRNSRIRRALEAAGANIALIPRSRARGRLRRIRDDVAGLVRGARRADVIVVSEFRLTHAPLVWLVARLVGARLVVDGFVGLHETVVDDWASTPARSIRSRLFVAQDHLAIRSADLYLIDTEVRAAAVRSRAPRTCSVVALPVGAPAWASFREPTPSDTLRIRYYGNYIPLHGLGVVLDGLDRLIGRCDFQVLFVGDGRLRPGIEARAAASPWASRAEFRGSVPETELAELIARSDVVLGFFGSSSKARGVIANKVWQGLACGRPVVTQASDALADLPTSVAPLIVTTEPGSARSLADALAAVAHPDPVVAGAASARLEASVADRFTVLGAWLDVESNVLAGQR